MKKFLACFSVSFLLIGAVLSGTVLMAQQPNRPPRPMSRPTPAPPNDFYRMPPIIPHPPERNVYPPRYFNDYRPPVPPIRRYNGPPMYRPPYSPPMLPPPPIYRPPVPYGPPIAPPPPPPIYRPGFRLQIVL